MQGEAQNGGWKKCDNDRQRKTPRAGIGWKADQHVEKPLEIENADGKDRTELNHHVEDFGARPVKADEIAGDNEMTGRRDGQELRQPFDNAEHEHLKDEVEGHFEHPGLGKGGNRAIF